MIDTRVDDIFRYLLRCSNVSCTIQQESLYASQRLIVNVVIGAAENLSTIESNIITILQATTFVEASLGCFTTKWYPPYSFEIVFNILDYKKFISHLSNTVMNTFNEEFTYSLENELTSV